MRRLLEERDFPVDEIRFFASARSAGTHAALAWRRDHRRGCGERRSLRARHRLVLRRRDHRRGRTRRSSPRPGATVIDNSSAFRMDPDVPLVVPEVNGHLAADAPKGIIANPNCTTMAAMPVLKPLHDESQLVRLVASTYQAVSGAGRRRCRRARRAGAQGRRPGRPAHLRRVSRGVPSRGEVRSVRSRSTCCPSPARSSTTVRSETDEERKLRNETRKILDIPDLPVSGTCVRVPVFAGHSLSLNTEFARPLSVERATELLRDAPGSNCRTSRRRSRQPAATPPTWVASAPTKVLPGAAASPCSSPATTSAKAPPSTQFRSPNYCSADPATRVDRRVGQPYHWVYSCSSSGLAGPLTPQIATTSSMTVTR